MKRIFCVLALCFLMVSVAVAQEKFTFMALDGCNTCTPDGNGTSLSCVCGKSAISNLTIPQRAGGVPPPGELAILRLRIAELEKELAEEKARSEKLRSLADKSLSLANTCILRNEAYQRGVMKALTDAAKMPAPKR